MLRLELVRDTDIEVVYNYFPEQENIYGTITINKGSGDIVKYEISSNDKHGRYLHHAIARIEKYVDNEDYQAKDFVEWY